MLRYGERDDSSDDSSNYDDRSDDERSNDEDDSSDASSNYDNRSFIDASCKNDPVDCGHLYEESINKFAGTPHYESMIEKIIKKFYFQNLSDKLKDDKKVVENALLMDPENIWYASDKLKSDRGFIIKMLEIGVDPKFLFGTFLDIDVSIGTIVLNVCGPEVFSKTAFPIFEDKEFLFLAASKGVIIQNKRCDLVKRDMELRQLCVSRECLSAIGDFFKISKKKIKNIRTLNMFFTFTMFT